jgi:abortive infection bacteriophage resistance protein
MPILGFDNLKEMGKYASDIEGQIRLLQARGMKFESLYDIEKAKEVLMDIGYYRLGFYWQPFEVDNHPIFRSGLTFKDVVDLYYLDSDLRELLFKAIKRIEINFRTQLVYQVSNIYASNAHWYVDPEIVLDKFVQNFKKNYYTAQFIRSNKAIKKHHAKYPADRYAPAWKTLEYLTFGSIEILFKSILDEDVKMSIALRYGINRLDIFFNYLNTIVFIRNICAHNEVLFDSNTAQGIKLTSLISISKDDRHSLYGSIQVILYFLGQISHNRKVELEVQMKELLSKYTDHGLIRGVIERRMKIKL